MRSFRVWLRSASVVGLAGALVLATGCGKPTGSVTGKVTYKGTPLKGGGVTFVSSEGQSSKSATINEDGTYSVQDIVAGNYKITVDTSFMKTETGGYGSGFMPGGSGGAIQDNGPPPGVTVPEGYTPSSPKAMQSAKKGKNYVAIPPQYANPESTDLTYTVVGGAQAHDIELK